METDLRGQSDSHWLIVGPTGTGKSTLIETKIMERIEANRRLAVVGIFPHGGDVGSRIAHRMILSDPQRLVWDDARDTEKVLRLKRCIPSVSPGAYERQRGNADAMNRIIEGLLARRRQQHVIEMPLIEDGLSRGLGLWLNQNPLKEEDWVVDAFRPGTDRYLQLLDECTDEESIYMAQEVVLWTKMEQLKNLLPAKRVIDGGFGSKTYVGRINGETRLGDLIDRGKVCIFEGDKKDRAGVRFWFITIIHEVCRHVESGSKCPVILIIDEANSWLLVDPYLCQMLAELRKDQLQVWISVQRPGFGDEEILEDVLTNCSRIYCFRPQSETVAKTMGFLMGMPTAHPDAIHWIETKYQQFHDGYYKELVRAWGKMEGEGTSDSSSWSKGKGTGASEMDGWYDALGMMSRAGSLPQTSKLHGFSGGLGESSFESESQGGSRGHQQHTSKSESVAEQFLSSYRIEEQKVPHYFSMDEQVKITISQMMGMNAKGQVMVKDGGEVWAEQIRKLPEIEEVEWLKKHVTNKLRATLKNRPIYQPPFVRVTLVKASAAERVKRKQIGKNGKKPR